jgi:hypothetical protein
MDFDSAMHRGKKYLPAAIGANLIGFAVQVMKSKKEIR